MIDLKKKLHDLCLCKSNCALNSRGIIFFLKKEEVRVDMTNIIIQKSFNSVFFQK